MKKYGFLLLLCFSGILYCGNRHPTSVSPPSGPFLGFNLMPGPNNGMICYALVTPLPNGNQNIQHLTRNEFIRRASGVIHCEGNPDGENLFSKYEVEDCGIYRDTIFKKTNFVCTAVDDIWKLRYKTDPYANGVDSVGWTKATIPSNGQMSILKQYGAENLSDYIYGENAFKLLHDMQSYAWQTRYKGS